MLIALIVFKAPIWATEFTPLNETTWEESTVWTHIIWKIQALSSRCTLLQPHFKKFEMSYLCLVSAKELSFCWKIFFIFLRRECSACLKMLNIFFFPNFTLVGCRMEYVFSLFDLTVEYIYRPKSEQVLFWIYFPKITFSFCIQFWTEIFVSFYVHARGGFKFFDWITLQ